jgi:hypothetical protein
MLKSSMKITRLLPPRGPIVRVKKVRVRVKS